MTVTFVDTPGSTLPSRAETIEFTSTDTVNRVQVIYDGEEVFDGIEFKAPFEGSTKVGNSFSVKRTGGWQKPFTLRVEESGSQTVNVHSHPASGTVDYSTRHELLFAFTEWLIGTGFFTEVRASDGSTVALGAIADAADFNNVGSHRVLRSKDGHEVAFWRRTSASAWTFLVAVSPGFVTGGDATTVPTAADEFALIGSRAAGADFDPNIGSTEYFRFVADDMVDGQVYWGFGSFYSNFLRYGVFRFPVVPFSPDVADPDPAVYSVITNGTDTFFARSEAGTWGSPTSSLPGPSPYAGTFRMVPHFWNFTSSDFKGYTVHFLGARRGGTTEKGVYETPRGYWAAEQSQCYYMGETEPDLSSAGFPSSGTAYELFPYGAPT